MKADALLRHTAGIIEDRGEKYGPASELCEELASTWSMRLGVHVTPAQVCLMMADMEIARAWRDPGDIDHFADLCGYAALGSEVADMVPWDREGE